MLRSLTGEASRTRTMIYIIPPEVGGVWASTLVPTHLKALFVCSALLPGHRQRARDRKLLGGQ